MQWRQGAALAALAGTTMVAQANDVYGGVGFPGLALGFAHAYDNGLAARAEYNGGLSVNRDGQREGLSYKGSLKTGRFGGFVDWFPFGGTFRVAAGLTFNDMKATLDGQGSKGTINGKAVDLTGETFTVNVKFPSTTPYLGLGWGHQRSTDKGLGFFADLGVQFGKFGVDVQTSIVGKFGVTQADVDAEANKVRDTVGKYSVLPTATLGLTYRF